MKRILITSLLVLGVAGCGVADRLGLDFGKRNRAGAAPADPFVTGTTDMSGTTLSPATAAPPPPAAARTAEALDTTTAEQRAAATAAPGAPSSVLGRTVVSLGSPTEPGLWLKTPLVQTDTQGRVANPATGQSALVTLIPLDGPATAGSQMSLAAMRLIGVSLTDLTEVEVSADS